MAKGVNRVTLVGHLGNDPEARYMPNGNAVVTLSLATSESWKNKQGVLQERTEWHRISVFNKLAEICAEYLKKGSLIYLEGKLRTRKWQDQQGNDRYSTEIIMQELQMLGGKPKQNGEPPASGYNNPDGSPMTPEQVKNAGKPPISEPDFDFDDDIPFAPIGLQYRQLLNCI